MTEYEMIQKLLEPFSVIDGKIYFNREDGKQEDCFMLRVLVRVYFSGYSSCQDHLGVTIYGGGKFVDHRIDDICIDPVELCRSIRSEMQRKFGDMNHIYSTIYSPYDDPADYYFTIYRKKNNENFKYREECRKKVIELGEKIQKTQELLVEKQRELVPISSEYHNLISAKNKLPFYALKQKKEYDKKIIAIKPKVNSLEDEIARLQSRIAGLIDKRNDADRAQYSRPADANGRQYKDFG